MAKKTQMKKGGEGGASGFGVAAYGFNQTAQQSEAGGSSNAIAVHPPANCMKGGKRKTGSKRRHAKLGGSTLLDIAVPAALFAANHVYRPKKSSVSFRRKSSGNKFNRTRRMSSRRRA